MSGESELDKFVSHRFLYFLGFLTGWNSKGFSVELLPIIYFFLWAIVLFGLNEINFALLFLFSGLIILIYFIILHTLLSSWDKIKLWLIRRAKKVGGIKNLNLEDIKYLLIYTGKVFGLKSNLLETELIPFNEVEFKNLLQKHKLSQTFLNISIIFSLLVATSVGIYGMIIKANILIWLLNWWFLFTLIFLPILVAIVILSAYKIRIKDTMNSISINQFTKTLKILNEFELFGGKIK